MKMIIEVTIREGSICLTGKYTADAFEKHPSKVLADIMKGVKAMKGETKEVSNKIDNSGMDNFVLPV